ncbi:lipocalin family protein [Mucilaginibacter terrae]|uniref:Apolipoprotein D and lipocalin family protein n=1 Tax=Mucilaginibacter terrae TaxID=1955052 RepID=A0ABU3GNM8_9SPHI|nr:lipocalin family protein [Mucilaginibacter terrae]MDT3401384.1 apolipoprotein D and lipocalin family protein [Mucilaginibacter terrae]
MNIKRTSFVIAMMGAAAATAALALSACVAIPKGAYAVKPFNKDKYLGTWYEVARMDFKFEKGLSQVTATYSIQDTDKIRVDNKGFNKKEGKWKQSIGKAKFVEGPETGRLKVSFFGPFYSGYNVIAIDPDYKYALIAGNNLKYLWLLSRTPDMPAEVKEKYLAQAKALGYKTEDLVWTDHSAL